jgi:ubiquitin-protein ligase
MRNQISAKNQTLVMRRLARDYAELKNSEIPLVGVSGTPDEQNMLLWHVNIKAPDETPWKGAVFHLLMRFTKYYPSKPPEITVMTPLTHPCV